MPRPKLSTQEAGDLVGRLYGFTVTKIKELISYDDRNYHVLVDTNTWDNPHVTEIRQHGYVFKVLNAEDSKHTHVDAEHGTQRVLLKAGFICPFAIPNKKGEEHSLELLEMENDPLNAEEQPTSGHHTCRLMAYVSGTTLRGIPTTDTVLYELGKYMAKMHQALEGYNHKDFESRHLAWDLRNLLSLDKYLSLVKDDSLRQLFKSVFTQFEKDVLLDPAGLREGVIHGDFTDVNILVDVGQDASTAQDGSPIARNLSLIAVIDFGDMAYSYHVLDLAISMAHLMTIRKDDTDFLDVARHMLNGYQSVLKLTKKEVCVLRVAVAARYTQYLTILEHTRLVDPDNEYALRNAERWTSQFKLIWGRPEQEFYKALNL